MRLRDYLLMTGMTVLAAIAIGCSKPSKTNTPRNTSKPEVVSTANNDSIDNRVICTGNGNGDADRAANGVNGTGPDPLYQLVEDTIKKYDGLGGDNLPKDKANVYISEMQKNLERLAKKDLSGLNTGQKDKISGAYTTQAFALMQLKRYSEAIEQANIALKVKNTNIQATFNLAATFYHTKQYRKSWETLNRVLELDPNHSKALSSRRNLERKYGFKN